MKFIRMFFVCFMLFFLVGCEYIIGYGTLEKRYIEPGEGRPNIYKVEILDDGCNCTRSFGITHYVDWYKPSVGSKVFIKQGLTATFMFEDK